MHNQPANTLLHIASLVFVGCIKVQIWDGVFVGTGERILIDQAEAYGCLGPKIFRRKRSLQNEREEFGNAIMTGECYELKPNLLKYFAPMAKFLSLGKATICSCLSDRGVMEKGEDPNVCTP